MLHVKAFTFNKQCSQRVQLDDGIGGWQLSRVVATRAHTQKEIECASTFSRLEYISFEPPECHICGKQIAIMLSMWCLCCRISFALDPEHRTTNANVQEIDSNE